MHRLPVGNRRDRGTVQLTVYFDPGVGDAAHRLHRSRIPGHIENSFVSVQSSSSLQAFVWIQSISRQPFQSFAEQFNDNDRHFYPPFGVFLILASAAVSMSFCRGFVHDGPDAVLLEKICPQPENIVCDLDDADPAIANIYHPIFLLRSEIRSPERRAEHVVLKNTCARGVSPMFRQNFVLAVVAEISTNHVCRIFTKVIKVFLLNGTAMLHVVRYVRNRDKKVVDVINVNFGNHSVSLATCLFEHIER